MSWVDGLRHRLRTLIHPRTYAREQAEERHFHREMEHLHGPTGGASAGGPRPELNSPGGERSRRAGFLEPLAQDLGYALRGLSRSPGFTALAVLTLALGVGANGAVFSLLDRIFGQPPPGLTAADDLRRLYFRFPEDFHEPGMIYRWFNYPAYAVVREALAGEAEIAAWTQSAESTLLEGGELRSARVSYVTHDFFSVLGVEAAHGRLFGPDEAGVDVAKPVAVISHAFWERALGLSPEALGRTFTLDRTTTRGRTSAPGGTTFTIVGVAAEGFAGLDLSRTDVFLHASAFPVQSWGGTPLRTWLGGNLFQAVARVPLDADEAPLEQRGTAAYARVDPDYDDGRVLVMESIIEGRGAGRRARPGVEQQAFSISVRAAGVSAILLVIACANVAGLLLVRAARRRQEIAVRLALGVSRRRLMSQLLTEGLVLALLSAAASVLLSTWGGALLRALLLPDVAWAGPVVDARTVLFALGSAVAMGLVAALAPLPGSRRVDVTSALKAGARSGGATTSATRSVLLVAQVALSIVLLMGAALFVRSLQNVAALRLGVDVEELAWVVPTLPSEQPGLRRELATRLGGLPGVSGTALARWAPMRGLRQTRVFLASRDSLPTDRAFPNQNTVSPDFFAVTGMRMLEGRTFEAGEQGVAVVSEATARSLWPTEGALGQCLIVEGRDGPCLEVIGVVEDSRRDALIEEETARWYFLPREEDAAGGTILLRFDPRRWGEVAAAAHDESARLLGTQDVRIQRMTEALEPQMRPWRLGARLFTAFGFLALLVTTVGVYAALAYAVSQRTHEMGVRMALGAQLRDILRLVVGEGLQVVAAGVVLGGIVALAAGRLVEPLLFGVTPRDPFAMSAVAAVLVAAGVTASFLPAWRAGQVDPADTLRQE